MFVPDARGWLRALDAKTGKELWKANDGKLHNGGIISYEVNGKQYIATVTGFPSMVSEGYPAQFPDAPVQVHGAEHRRVDRLHAGINLGARIKEAAAIPRLSCFLFSAHRHTALRRLLWPRSKASGQAREEDAGRFEAD